MKLDYNYPVPLKNGQWAARFIFIAGRLSIDFTLTGGKTPERAYWERLHSPDDLRDWFAASPLRLPDVAISQADFDHAVTLREAIWYATNALLDGASPALADLETINRTGAQPDLAPELTIDGAGYTWRAPFTAQAALSSIARDAVDLFTGDLRERIRRCENPNCGLIFVDQSRPGKRRWCLMERCGNLMKTRRYQRKKAEEGVQQRENH